MFCQECGSEMVLMAGVFSSSMKTPKTINAESANIRMCDNKDCDRYQVWENFCSEHGWYDAEQPRESSDIVQCPFCRRELELYQRSQDE